MVDEMISQLMEAHYSVMNIFNSAKVHVVLGLTHGTEDGKL